MHATLARQLRRHLPDGLTGASPEAEAAFLAAVSASYADAQRDRALVAHSLETLSSELVERNDSLRRTAEAYRLLFEQNPTPMWVYAPQTRRILAVNDAAVAHYGYDRERFLQLRLDDLRPADAADQLEEALASTTTNGRHTHLVRHRTRDGALLEVEVTGHAVEWEGATARLVLALDVTERRRLEAQLRRQAFHDELTGLANRALFRDRLEHAIARATRAGQPLCVQFLDLDGFKRVNDSLGHAVGDALLVAVARRVALAVRAGDTVARLGGDEFAILLECAHQGEAEAIATRIIDACRPPFRVDDRDVSVGVSVGIAAHQPGISADELQRNADTAMYEAKESGRNQWARYAPEMHARALARLELEEGLRGAIANDELTVVYQPIVDLASRRGTAVEALLRWRHPRFGDVPPATFIPIAEETGLILSLGRWVLHEACRQTRAWQLAELAAGSPDAEEISVSVNVSGRQLDAESLLDDVQAALDGSGLRAECLTLEITESAIMRDAERAVRRLGALRTLGVRLAIDDFGTGYSSLSYLRQFPIDVLKIDKSFVDHVAQRSQDSLLVRTIVALGESLGLRLVAEGIERAEQSEALRALGCTVGQGYHFGRPVPADSVYPFLQRAGA